MPIARPINFGPLAKGVARGVPEVLVGMDKWTEDTSHNDGLDVGLPKEVEAMVSKANDRMDDANFILFQWGSNRCGGSQVWLPYQNQLRTSSLLYQSVCLATGMAYNVRQPGSHLTHRQGPRVMQAQSLPYCLFAVEFNGGCNGLK